MSQSKMPVLLPTSAASRDTRLRLCPPPTAVFRSLKIQVTSVQRLPAEKDLHLKLPRYIFPTSPLPLMTKKSKTKPQPNEKPILKAVLSKRRKREPPTSPNLPARWLFNSPLQTLHPCLHSF